MRILMLLYNPVGMGTYWRALHLARGLACSGHEITLMATPQKRHLGFYTRPDVETGVTLLETPDILGEPFRSGWDPYSTLRRMGWVGKRDFDLVHGFESRPTVILPALYWKRRRRGCLILDWCDWFGRGGSVEERQNRLLRTCLRPVETYFEERFRCQADGTTVINDTLQRRAVALGVAPETILPLPNGSNVEELVPVDRSEARQSLGWPQKELLVGYIGSIFQGDAALMAEAFNKLHQAEPRTRLLLIGYCNVPVEQLVDAPAAVWRTGKIHYSEINHYLAACDLCWLPQRDVGANRGRSPLKVKDYMAVGRPVVATDVGDVSNLVRRGEFGLVTPASPAGLARGTLDLLHRPQKRQMMGRRARQLAETDFSWHRIAGQLEQFYQEIIQ